MQNKELDVPSKIIKKLEVFLHRNIVGELLQDVSGRIYFEYSKEYLSHSDAVSISHSLPLMSETFSSAQCVGFFSGILPEDEKRKIIAKNLGISAKNDFKLLELIGGECAGAISFLPAGSVRKDLDYDYHKIDKSDLKDILLELPKRPLLAGNKAIRLSLAGAQDKLPVMIQNEEVFLPLGGAPSSHILKPAIDRFKDIVMNEAFCMKLAAAVGISSAEVATDNVDKVDYLIIKRYDRNLGDNGKLQRLHQEDFCQALNISPLLKYQSEGGPSLELCFNLIREVSSMPVVDLKKLLQAVIFNFLVGNNDAHGKNFSFIYDGDHRVLAPMYDLVCTAYYPELSKKMAMKIGGKNLFEDVYPRHFEKLAEQAGLGKKLVFEQLLEIASRLTSEIQLMKNDDPITSKISEIIIDRCNEIMRRCS